ncbi:MAG: SMC-Scp complex subunit ScpB [Bacteroidia bacterium]
MEAQKIIEALIFAADNPLRPAQILELFQNEDFFGIKMDEELLADALAAIRVKYESDEHVFELRQIDGGYQFFTKVVYYPYLKHAVIAKSTRRMSRASLETLSIIAYKQPITKTEIEFIRGVNCDYAVAKLLEKNLIEMRGRSEAAGRPLLYGTTSYFMEYFALNDIGDLPKLQEVHSDEKDFQTQFKVYVNDGEDAAEEEAMDRVEELERNEELHQITIAPDDEELEEVTTEDLESAFRRMEGDFTIKDLEEE